LGQGSESGDGKSESDFSGTYLLNGAAYNTWSLAGSIRQIDGGRDERLRYDSPKLGGVATISVDVDTNDDIGIAVGLGGSNWRAGLYNESRDANGSDETGGSVAFNFGGVTAALQAGSIDETATGSNDDRDFSKFIIGYRSGAYSVSIDVASSETDSGTAVDNETRGLNFVYRPAAGIELYAGTRVLDNKLTNAETDGYLAGARVRF
jgi:hypothetical protein